MARVLSVLHVGCDSVRERRNLKLALSRPRAALAAVNTLLERT